MSDSPSIAPNGADDREWKALVVDDEQSQRGFMQRILEARGIGVCLAENSEAVAREMNDCLIGMVVMDVLIPGGQSGISIAQDLRKANPYLPILFISADPSSIAHLCEDERLEKSDPDFRRKLIVHVRDQMGRYVARQEARSTAKVVRQILPRLDVLERSRVVDGEVIKAHAEMHKGYKTLTSKGMLVKQIAAGVLTLFTTIIAPTLAAVWWVTKDIAAETFTEAVHSIKQIAPMRAEQAELRRTLDRLEAERQDREKGK